MCQPIGSFEKCMLMSIKHLPKATMAKILALKPMLHYFMFELKLMWHSNLRMLHYFKYYIKSLFLCTLLKILHKLEEEQVQMLMYVDTRFCNSISNFIAYQIKKDNMRT
jgi:hypothetical protein